MLVPTLCLFSFSIAMAAMSDFLRPKIIKLQKFDGTCPGQGNVPIVLRNIRISLVNKSQVVSMKVITKEDIFEDLRLELTLTRCSSREALDSCEKYRTVSLNHLCDLLNAEDKPWTPFLKLSEPPMNCPIRKRVHVISNGTFDGGSLSNLPIAGWHWIVTAELFGNSTKRRLMCCKVAGQIAPV